MIHHVKAGGGTREKQRMMRHVALAKRRKHHLVRGEVGLQFAVGADGNSIHHSLRGLARACDKLGYDVAVRLYRETPRDWPETSIRHIQGIVKPPICTITWGHAKIDEVPVACARVDIDVPDSWHYADENKINELNRECDLFVTLSESGLDQYFDGGLEIHGAVIPLGVDRNVYRPLQNKERNEYFQFLTAGYIQERKGLDVLLEAFKLAFKEDEPVELVVKTVAEQWGESVANKVIKARGHHRIRYIEKDLDEFAFARLLGQADCYVSPHKREGFGLIPLQAMACGVPVVATNYDGPTQYLTSDNAILVEPECFYNPGGNEVPKEDLWAVVNPADLAKALRRAYEERRGDARRQRIQAGLETAGRYGWEHAAQKLVDAVETVIGPVRKKPAIKSSRYGTCDILIPCRNGQKDIEAFADSLNGQWYGAELRMIIFDDASEEPLITPKNAPPGSYVIRSEAWLGEGGGRDRLLRESDAEFVFMTDADVMIPDTNFFRRLMERACEKYLLTPLMLLPDGRVWSAGGCYHRYGSRMLPAWHRMMGEALDRKVLGKLSNECVYAPGAGWFARREELLKDWAWVGGYFPTIFTDIDLSFWLRMHGWKIMFVRDAECVHNCGSYTTKQTDVAAQAERFEEHAQAVISQWGSFMMDDLERGADFW